ncbi:response regulator transcription factor [Paucibacter sp. TC2R-5]|uniref:response regulator n=1 Tax=Paucibacter sp. TC2R-5 TaxID=2893555 RepID=UPI0021E403FE|nr:response regulator transcription factor [Paucibacter sp. TC2R-5]MCV2360672.1 response regulator transcription factor [Paucibacter sp. TC2R-5]
MPTTRILIAEDHAMLADALSMLLNVQEDMQCVGIARDGASALRLTLQTQPDILLLDLGLPQLDGLAVMKALQAQASLVRTIVVTARMDAGSVRAALALGAAGYVPKNESSSELLLAVRRVAQGRSYISNEIANLFMDADGSSPAIKLTASEITILQLVGEGFTSKEIGIKLGISEGTVRKHRENLRSKLGIRNSAEMAAYAIRTQASSPIEPKGC